MEESVQRNIMGLLQSWHQSNVKSFAYNITRWTMVLGRKSFLKDVMYLVLSHKLKSILFIFFWIRAPPLTVSEISSHYLFY